MTKAYGVLSTPPTNTPMFQRTDSAPGAVQLSSPPVILTSHAPAEQESKTSQNHPAVRRFSEAGLQSVGSLS